VDPTTGLTGRLPGQRGWVDGTRSRHAGHKPRSRTRCRGYSQRLFAPRRHRASAQPLGQRLDTLDQRPHTFEPMTAFAQADAPSQLFEYCLLDTTGYLSNDPLLLLATAFNRFAVIRELTDGLLSPWFAPSQSAWLQGGCLTPLRHSIEAFIPKTLITGSQPRPMPAWAPATGGVGRCSDPVVRTALLASCGRAAATLAAVALVPAPWSAPTSQGSAARRARSAGRPRPGCRNHSACRSPLSRAPRRRRTGRNPPRPASARQEVMVMGVAVKESRADLVLSKEGKAFDAASYQLTRSIGGGPLLAVRRRDAGWSPREFTSRV
jgi:hypothetical protein